jgi:epoxyqueuosine reductase
MTINSDVRTLAAQWGADFFGVADLAPAHDFILAQGGTAVAGYPRAVSVGIELLHAIVDQLPHRAQRAVTVEYRSQAYDVINQRLDLITSQVGSFLQRLGYSAYPVPASQRVDDERICGVFSNKLAAHLAGLGWIGKSCLLVTPEAGPRVRWATVLTDAPLTVTGQPMDQRCGDCLECVDICPVGAFTGEPFREQDPREVRYHADKCDRYFDALEEQGRLPVCGMCLYVCPYGRERGN